MNKLVAKEVSLLGEDNIAFAGVNLNPLVRWVKFILTDDKPNANNQRIPREEFSNLIKTGLYMPIKTAPMDSVEKRHFNAGPIGAITHLKIEDDKVLGLAALWEKERPEDVEKIVEAVKNGEQIDLSWEIAYSDREIEESGVEVLKDVALLGTTIVDIPAYEGRTPILSVAEIDNSEKWDKKYINDLPDSAFLYIEPGGKKDEEGKTVPRSLRHLPYKNKEGKIDLPHLRNAITRLSQENTGKKWLTEELRNRLLEKARKLLEKVKEEESEMEELAEAKKRIEELEAKLKEYEEELSELRSFKEEVEKEKAEAERFDEIKKKFKEAGVEKDNEYFESNRERLLSMSEDAIEFLLQEMVAALAEVNKEENDKETSASIPDFSTNSDEDDPVEKVKKLLRNRK